MGQTLVIVIAARFAAGEQFQPLRHNGMWYLLALFLVVAMVLARSRGYSIGVVAAVFMIWVFSRGVFGNLGRAARIAVAGWRAWLQLPSHFKGTLRFSNA